MRPTQPYEAKQAPRLELDDADVENAARAAVIAVAGFVYTGDTPDAVLSTLRFLSARPDVRAALWPADPS